ncbi:MAG: hypothetical protein P8M25_16070 [Paracoccaceae bacterium]|nr:hypothetical protein [Paracoccaceae bacterium]
MRTMFYAFVAICVVSVLANAILLGAGLSSQAQNRGPDVRLDAVHK